jgi:hypothetical protein
MTQIIARNKKTAPFDFKHNGTIQTVKKETGHFPIEENLAIDSTYTNDVPRAAAPLFINIFKRRAKKTIKIYKE